MYVLPAIFLVPRATAKAPVQDEIRFMRIRTKRHEIMISPGESILPWLLLPSYSIDYAIYIDKRYLLAVLHDPAT